MNTASTIDKFLDEALDLYGICGHRVKLGNSMGTKVFEAIEDECDGYRSMLANVPEVVPDSDDIFFPNPIAKVRITAVSTRQEGFSLVDVDTGHTWLFMGTDRDDSYYPRFQFIYSPDETRTVEAQLVDEAWEKFQDEREGCNLTPKQIFEGGMAASVQGQVMETVRELALSLDADQLEKYANDRTRRAAERLRVLATGS